MYEVPVSLNDLAKMTQIRASSLSLRLRSGDIKANIQKAKDNRHYIYDIKLCDFGDFLRRNPHYRKAFIRAYQERERCSQDIQTKMRLLMEYLRLYPCNYSVLDIARMCMVNETTVYEWRNRGYLVQDAGRYYYSASSVERCFATPHVSDFVPLGYYTNGLFWLYVHSLTDQ